MTGIVHAVREPVREPTDVLAKIDALRDAATAGEGRLDPEMLSEAVQVVDRAEQRLRMSGDLMVVALAGATGAGKSSTFNAITGFDLAAVGVRRPLTTQPLACVWGEEPAAELLTWLGVPRRHQVSHRSTLQRQRDVDMDGLVLLDLPDHDSTELEHNLIVDRLVELVDMMIWVVSPQKYADAVLHNRYLRRLAPYASVMVFALNHADELSPADRDRCVADFDRLLRNDGIEEPTILATSATTGYGLADLRALLVERLGDKRAARDRLAADVERVVARLTAECGTASTPQIAPADIEQLVEDLAEASGVCVLAEAAGRCYLRRARAATGWPLTKWVARLRRDPLRRLRPRRRRWGSGTGGVDGLPQRGRLGVALVQRARVDTAVRAIATKAAAGLTRPWSDAVRAVIREREGLIADELDAAVARTDLGVARKPRWWTLNQLLQWLLFLVALSSGLWLLSPSLPELPERRLPGWSGIPYAAMIAIGGAVLGVLAAVVCRLCSTVGASRHTLAVDAAMRSELAAVADAQIVRPTRDELVAYTRCRDSLTRHPST